MTEPAPKPFDSKHLELSLIGWIVNWPGLFYEVEDFEPAHFEHVGCRRVFEVLHDLHARHGSGALETPSMIAKAMTRKGWTEEDAFSLLTEVVDYAPAGPSGIDGIKQAVIQGALQRALKEAAGELGAIAEKDDAPENIAEEASNLILRAVSTGAGNKVGDMKAELDLEARRMNEVDEGNLKEFQGISTGLKPLDKILGGLHGGEMIIMGGRPGMGKSALLGSMIRSMVVDQKLPGLIISMEMRRQEYATRMLCYASDVDLHAARNRLLNPEQRERYAAEAAVWQETSWYIHDQGAITLPALNAIARRMYHENGIKWIGIDYLQLMDHQRSKNDTSESSVSRTSKGIKALALQLDIPIVALAQLNRDCDRRDNKRPRLSDLRESGSLEQDADVVAFVYRASEYYTPDEAEQHKYDQMEDAEIIVAKQRNGPTGTAKVAFYRKSARFANMPHGSGEPEIGPYTAGLDLHDPGPEPDAGPDQPEGWPQRDDGAMEDTPF